jgi:conjugal transfer ATP-binding protein TraC
MAEDTTQKTKIVVTDPVLVQQEDQSKQSTTTDVADENAKIQEATPAWLKKAQLEAAQNNQTLSPATEVPVSQTETAGSEKEADLAGLQFEGIEPEKAKSEDVKLEAVKSEAIKPAEVKPEALKSETKKEIPDLNIAKLDKAIQKEEKIESKTIEIPKAEQIAKEQQQKSVTEMLNKGFFGFLKSTKAEIEKGKTAGIADSAKTLEDYGKSKEQKAFEQSTEGKSKAQVDAVERQKLIESEKVYQEGMASVRDLIAPSSMDINYDYVRVEGMYARSLIVYSYPRYLDTNWMSPVVNFDVTMDIAQFIYPIDSARIMKILSKKVTQMQSSMSLNAERGLIRDPALETAYEDAEQLRTEIQRGQEKFFQFAMYITIFADSLKKIQKVTKQMESILGSKLILTKRADLRMEHGFNSTMPMGLDEIEIFRNMNSGPLSTTFPFSSSDLTSNEGILYGLNRHNDSLIIFDRFSLPNANSCVFAISGAGKSYAVKLEILRYLMLGVDVIVIDPENEYESLAQTVGGAYLKVSLTSDRRINPFDLPSPLKDEELQPGDLLRSNIITLHGLLKIMLGGMTPEEEGIMDRALNDVYALKGITMEIVDPSSMPVPTMEDLHALLINMEGATSLAQRLEKYTRGTYSGIFNMPTNVDLKSGLMVFSIRDLEDSLRPIAMYIILNYIWNRIRSQLKRRLMIVDEAWTMMQHEDSARFLFGLVKRARKYYLGITTITQDVEDFIKSPYGKPIVTNSAMQLLLKQSSASISMLQKLFNLTEGEKYMLLNSGVGQGVFFAGMKHVAMQIIASYTEDKIITTNPEEILRTLGASGSVNEQYE